VPVEFAKEADYDKIECGDELQINNLLEMIKSSDKVKIINATSSFDFVGRLELSEREREILLSAGLLNYTRKKAVSK
jgi:aconitate hydratase